MVNVQNDLKDDPVSSGARADEQLDPKAKKAAHGAFSGFFIDMYDIYLPVVALGPAMVYFLSPTMPASQVVIVTSLIFVSTLLGRPLGALIGGRFADQIGRKKVNLIAVSGYGLMSFAMAAMPGYETWGIAAVIVFIVLRLVDGVFVGGSYSAASPLAMERLPRKKRGVWGAYIMLGFPAAFVAISALTLIMLQIAPADGLGSPYVQWGWRVPFIIGGLMAIAYVWWYAVSVEESEVFKKTGGTKSPLKTLFGSKRSLKAFAQVFVLMSGFWMSLNTVTAMLPGALQNSVGLTSTEVTILLCITFLFLGVGYMVAGKISQHVGRRPFLIFSGLGAAIPGTALYYWLLTSPPSTFLGTVLLAGVMIWVIVWFWGLATTYINERFQTGVRASGFGLGYSLAVIPPSFYAFYQVGLENFMPLELTVLPLLVIGGLLVALGAFLGPETKNVDFATDMDFDPETEGTAVV
ncbi:MFS transporter [Nesterenkonia sp. DZ6]|uniref:MFS transporter n=1 Tax=Nesterenkonia sp. DZ6 TaxID=2901229 RepID=UPI001F4CF98A|nr:MFS transporter [Nesterenkonia sp. DZ6]MCH8559252.1 MFS transporter [Nesterenkonia sp. DZ6]